MRWRSERLATTVVWLVAVAGLVLLIAVVVLLVRDCCGP
jgi:hypothetical protein